MGNKQLGVIALVLTNITFQFAPIILAVLLIVAGILLLLGR